MADIETNKSDFERALADLDELRNALEDTLSERVLEVMEKVSSEYNNYFRDNIQDLMQESDEKDTRIEELEQELDSTKRSLESFSGVIID